MDYLLQLWFISQSITTSCETAEWAAEKPHRDPTAKRQQRVQRRPTDHASCVQLVVVADHRNELKAAASASSVCQSARLSSVGRTVGRTGPDPDRYPRHDEHTSNEISRRHKSPKSTLDAQTQRRRLANWFTLQFMLVSVYARKFIKRNSKA